VPRPSDPPAPIDPPETPLPPVAAPPVVEPPPVGKVPVVELPVGGGWTVVDGGVVVVGGAGEAPDSVASSGPVQSESARSVRPSPSSSARFEHCGSSWSWPTF
jgi:hypothetical protein